MTIHMQKMEQRDLRTVEGSEDGGRDGGGEGETRRGTRKERRLFVDGVVAAWAHTHLCALDPDRGIRIRKRTILP
jgi:hypothetical protein